MHQVIICMIRKLGEDKKANWLSHLAEIAHAYNATHSTVYGYSPHHLMFGCRPRLPVDFFFPTIGSNEAPMREASTKCVDEYIASIWDRLRTTLQEVQAQSMVEACRQKWYFCAGLSFCCMINSETDSLIQNMFWLQKTSFKALWALHQVWRQPNNNALIWVAKLAWACLLAIGAVVKP